MNNFPENSNSNENSSHNIPSDDYYVYHLIILVTSWFDPKNTDFKENDKLDLAFSNSYTATTYSKEIII